ncbi:MAG: PSD1 and planctomycete cytochrome C domain-containing protein [Pirellulaceae bacterium]
MMSNQSAQRNASWIPAILLLVANVNLASADDAAFFRDYVEPLLRTRCYECHSHDSGEASGGLVLDSKPGWTVGGDSGTAIVPGEIDKSLLWRVVNHQQAGLEMPPDGKLPESERLLIKKWIETGAFDPRENGAVAERTAIDIEVGRRWWSFQPIKSPWIDGDKLASIAKTTRERTESSASPETGMLTRTIDQLIAERLRDSELVAAPEAQRATLLRRVAYDLTGLPPTSSMVADTTPLTEEAYASYVDELLDSKAFGEKWGRHWLDVARYADSNGSSFNVPFHNAWRYRNWVIEAFNRNMPMDAFIRKQVAGDLMPAETDLQRDENYIATGYLMLGSKVLGTFDKEQLTLDVIDEQLDTIGKSLLGMTLGCARCHDHKFDPIPQADYYALAGILGSTSTLVDRIGGPKDDESDWERRGLGPDGDARLIAFLNDHRYDWVRAVRKRFEAKKKLDEVEAALEVQRRDDNEQFPSTIGGETSLEADASENAKRLAEAQATFDEADQKLVELLARMPSHAMAARDAGNITDFAIRIRGVASSKGHVVPRGFLQVVSVADQLRLPANQSGRLELANWITSPENPLTPRVFVNRVWKHLFREGLVRSVDNFGSTGEQPTHPELLDAVAHWFLLSGWDVKRLIREMVLSDTYRRSTAGPQSPDPDNRLLAYQNRRRLEAEEIRDTMLLLSGTLKLGPNEDVLRTLPIGDASNLGEYLNIQDNRRTVYQPVIRTLEPSVLQLFDASGNTMVTGARPRTIVAPQSLYFLNSRFIQQSSEAIGLRLLALHVIRRFLVVGGCLSKDS